jgi:uncharacterized membrane protein YdbT with pleckstrin-like domain
MEAEPGEHIFFHGHPSWRSILDFYAKGIVLVVVAGAIAGIVSDIASNKVKVSIVVLVVLIGLLIMIAIGAVKRLRTTYTISTRALTIHIGIVSSEMHETRLERVQNVNATQSVLERMLGIGTVDFDTAASAEYDFKFRGVEDPHEIVRTVDRALHELQRGSDDPLASGGGPAAPSNSGDSV